MSGGVSKERIAELLKENLEAKEIIVIDTSGGCGAKFEVYVASKQFEKVKLLDRHRLVQEAVKEVSEGIHALTIKAWTPEQWESRKDQLPQVE